MKQVHLSKLPVLFYYRDMAKRTKIIATIGPACEDKNILQEMIKAGMNVARLNFSHGDYATNQKVIKNIREISKELDCPVGIMADLQGPRIRTLVNSDMEIKAGDNIKICDVSNDLKSQISNLKSQANPNDQNSNNQIVCLDIPGIVQDINVGNAILIEDGLMKLKVFKKEKDFLEAEVVEGGTIKNHKGVNIPDAKLNISAMTEKDDKDLEFALKEDVDFVALSFVSVAKDIEDLRGKIKKILGREPARNATHSVAGGDNLPQIVAKIERKEAIKNIDEIVKATDVVMVARGDLGIEMDESKVVLYQKEIIAKCLKAVKPVIVATQMLDSMIHNPIPTRAEVSDVSNAVIDHTDAVMLSGETANGKYPLKAIEMMAEIAKNTEDSPFDDINPGFLDGDIFSNYASIIDSAHELAKSSKAKAILVATDSGFTARIMSHHRPEETILVATRNKKTYNQLSIIWGVRAYLFDQENNREKLLELLIEKVKKEGKLSSGNKAVVIFGKLQDSDKVQMVGIKEIE
jgi:pyruvate kinase